MTKKMFANICLRAFVCLFAVQGMNVSADEIMSPEEQGLNLLAEGKYLEAAEFLWHRPELFLEKAKESDDALFVVGVIAERRNDLDTAYRIYDFLAQKGYRAAEIAIDHMIAQHELRSLEESRNLGGV